MLASGGGWRGLGPHGPIVLDDVERETPPPQRMCDGGVTIAPACVPARRAPGYCGTEQTIRLTRCASLIFARLERSFAFSLLTLW